MLLEVACFNPKSAIIAAEAGAGRIEFCTNYAVGGTTPTLEDFVEIRKKIKVSIFVMIHPKSGEYTYTPKIFDLMKNSIASFKKAGADGFVFASMYTPQGINIIQNKELVELAGPLPCTFHRAFDIMNDKEEAIQNIIKCGFTRILTSGKPGKAVDNFDLIKKLQEKYKEQVNIMPGGGIRSTNIQAFIEAGIFPEVHSAGILSGEMADKKEIQQMVEMLA
jgi:copper homeostasis protein